MRAQIQQILLEAASVVLLGAGFAFAANALSPRGLSLSRDYFPTSAHPPMAPSTASAPATPAAPSGEEDVATRLKGKGLRDLTRVELQALLKDPRHDMGLIVIVDARDPEKFRQARIPGALNLDVYHPEKQMSAVLAACQAAEQVVVYCMGGECEDADTGAILLRDAGVPADKISVYGGGMTEWTDLHLPTESGEPPASKP